MIKIIILLISSVLYYKISQTPNKTTSNDAVKEVVPQIGYFLGPLWLIFVFVAYSYIYYSFDIVEWDYIEVFGCVLTIASSLIRLWTYQTLGRLFTFDLAIRSQHKLITVGPYKYVRHPSYTALILSTLGYSLYVYKVARMVLDLLGITNISFIFCIFAPTIFITCFILIRIPKEEDMLQMEFKNKWIRYKNTTWRLIPFY
jgi:protein-S-isoprenylcysteine O-methyltransferase Ste14